jgi:hypothetical protein
VSDIWRYSLTQNYEIKIWVVDVAFPQSQRAGTPGIGPAAHDDEHCVGIDRANVPLTQETNLRSAIESERDLISRLKDKINNEHLKLLLQSAPSLAFRLDRLPRPEGKWNGHELLRN